MRDIAWSRFALDSLRSPWRWLVASAVAVAAVAHIPVIGPHLNEAPYMGGLFILLTAACAVLGLVVLIRDSRAAYALVVITCGLAVAGYVATRVIAFPMLADDVGNWLEPLGVVSIVSESIAVAAAFTSLHHVARQLDARQRGVQRARPTAGAVSSANS